VAGWGNIEGGTMAEKPKRGNASKTPPLSQIDSERERLPAIRANLSSKERSLLQDPDWIDEDEADAILAERIFQKEVQRESPFASI
jgi:hypothetical protein